MSPPDDHDSEALNLRAALDATDDVPAAVILHRAQTLFDLRDLDMRCGRDTDAVRADIDAARQMMRHVREHRAVPLQRLEDMVGLEADIGVLDREPGQIWQGYATLSDIYQEQAKDPLHSGRRIRLDVADAHTWVWADRVWSIKRESPGHPLEVAWRQVPTQVWRDAERHFIAARAVAIYALGSEVAQVIPAQEDGRLPPGTLGTVTSVEDTQDAQLMVVSRFVASLQMQHQLAHAGQSDLVLAAVEQFSDVPWRRVSEHLMAGLVVWPSRALADAQALYEIPEMSEAIQALAERLQTGHPVDGQTVTALSKEVRGAVRTVGVWRP